MSESAIRPDGLQNAAADRGATLRSIFGFHQAEMAADVRNARQIAQDEEFTATPGEDGR